MDSPKSSVCLKQSKIFPICGNNSSGSSWLIASITSKISEYAALIVVNSVSRLLTSLNLEIAEITSSFMSAKSAGTPSIALESWVWIFVSSALTNLT